MITINIAKAKEIIQKNEEKPKTTLNIIFNKPATAKPDAQHQQPSIPKAIAKAQLSSDAWADFNELMIEQAKLSNTIFDEVERGATQKELAALYARIESSRPELIKLYEIARHVDLHGELPAQKTSTQMPTDLFTLKDQKRKLIDKRNKLGTKIKLATTAERINELRLQLDQADAEYKIADEQIKKLAGK